MNKLQGEILTLPKMGGYVSTPKSLSGNIGVNTINIGAKGDDGATFTPSVSADGVISWTNNQDLPNPEPVNIKGAKGDDGYTPQKNIDYFDGKDGENGEKGEPFRYEDFTAEQLEKLKGDKGDKGDKGEAGYTPVKNKDYFDGKDGKNGTDGKDGYSPQKGVDYWTAEDKTEMVEAVLSALPIYDGEVVIV